MLGVFLRSGGGVEVREVEKPRARRGEVVVKLMACGICGTDLEKARGHGITTAVLGHEVSGVVEEIGDGVSGLKVGDRVFVHHHVSCGKCYYCLNESPTMCRLFLETNLEPCGMAEYFRVPAVNVERGAVIKLPDEIGFKTATFIEPLACCIRALDRISQGSVFSSAVIGFGPMGALFTMLLKRAGAYFVAVGDVSDFRLGFSEKAGADASINLREESMLDVCLENTDGRGVDVAIVATGNVKAYEEAFKIVRRGGVICVFGAPERNVKLELDLSRLFVNEISLKPSYSTTERETRKATELLRTRLIDPTFLITNTYKIQEAEQAFNTAANPQKSMKTIIIP